MTAHAPTTSPGLLKPLLGGVLTLVAVIAVAFGVLREVRNAELARAASATSREPAATIEPSRTPAAAPAPAVTTVYYFHGDTRCETCLTIEKQSAETVQNVFAADIQAGHLRFVAVNYDAPDNRHFRQDFDLAFGSVVVSAGEKWQNLAEVWTLVHTDRTAFDAYLVASISPYVKRTP